MYKCLKRKCDYYFESDIYEQCQIASEYLVDGKCIGFGAVNSVQEELAGKMSSLLKEYCKLEKLKSDIASTSLL